MDPEEPTSQDFEKILLDLGHIPLKNLVKSKIVDLVGVVIAFKPTIKSRGTDYSKNLVIVDPSLCLPGENGLSLNLFRPQENLLPDVRNIGDIILCRKLTVRVRFVGMYTHRNHINLHWHSSLPNLLHLRQIQEYNDKMQAVSIKAISTWATFDGNPDTPLEPRRSTWSEKTVIGEPQRKIVRVLREWWRVRNKELEQQGAIGGLPLLRRPRPQLTTVEILKEDMFLDYVGEVVGCWSDYGRPLMTLLLTDYTENPRLQDIEPGRNPMGVSGRRIVRCSLWDQNATRSQHINLASLVFLRNAKSELDGAGCLRLVVHGDKVHPDKVDVMRLREDDPRLSDLLRRRNEFQDAMREKEKVEREVREEQERQARLEPTQQLVYQTVIKYQDSPTRIANVLNSNEISTYRIRARVVDIGPLKLEGFTRPYCKECDSIFDPTPNRYTACPQCSASMTEDAYVYQFGFILKDEEGTELPVIVCWDDALDFLPGLPPAKYEDCFDLHLLNVVSHRSYFLIHPCFHPSFSLYENNCTLQGLRSRLSKICHLDTILHKSPGYSARGHPIVDWAIKSYLPDENDNAHDMRFRVFKTSIV
ncbi:hypothetical protein BC938DRAFT_479540 [Jimgerdemannia flammicorona]|uniref:Protection of telomeres protein 1 n=1 Tax=Jimgerdemannia flammicorona TaxID=994334 RepID=A0A433QKP3_9FUNG|nr:hypothetical protein BC938DRAFT_479540 [Jimgerdemannia flammicorona]